MSVFDVAIKMLANKWRDQGIDAEEATITAALRGSKRGLPLSGIATWMGLSNEVEVGLLLDHW